LLTSTVVIGVIRTRLLLRLVSLLLSLPVGTLLVLRALSLRRLVASLLRLTDFLLRPGILKVQVDNLHDK
jgi:hypothetical protein